MSLLAAPRRKQIVSANPQGLNNSEDWKQFGGKLMAKSGWQAGDGLGANRQGTTEHVRMKFKDDSLGLGCTLQYDQNWLAHNDDFNDLLSSLNQHYGGASTVDEANTEISLREAEQPVQVSLEKISKRSKGRIHYQKFARGKDLSSRSADDISMIFGGKVSKKKSKKSEVEPEVFTAIEMDKERSHDRVTGLNTYDSKESLHDYFAKKMASKRQVAQYLTNDGSKKSLELEKEEPDESASFTNMEHDYFSTKDVEEENAAQTKKRKKKRRAADIVEEAVKIEESFENVAEKVVEFSDTVKKTRKPKKIKTEDKPEPEEYLEKFEMGGEMVDEEETEEERRARRKRRKLEKRLAKAALEETKEELLEMEVDVFPTSADIQPDIVSMVTIPVDMTVQTEITERKDGTLEVTETVTNVRDLKKSMFEFVCNENEEELNARNQSIRI